MRIAALIAILPAWMLCGCVTTAPGVAIDDFARDTICKLSADIRWTPFGTVQWIEGANEIVRVNSSVNRSEFSALPPTIKCPDGLRRLHKPGHATPFAGFWVSKDRSRAAISGGYVGGALFGGGGTCYYRRSENNWVREGCVNEWSV